jgi:hypothetical protein
LIVETAIWFPDPSNCVLTGDEATPLAMSVDVKFNTRIAMAFVVGNRLIQNEQSNTNIDDSEIRIDSADVRLSFSGGAVSGSEFELTLPSNSILGGETGFWLVQLPESVAESLRSTMAGLPEGTVEHLEMEVIFRGYRTNSSGNGDGPLGAIHSGPYVYPFEICYGCLEDCSCGTCPTEDEWTGGFCGFAQGIRNITSPSCSEEPAP